MPHKRNAREAKSAVRSYACEGREFRVRLCLFAPDIPQNTGALIRLTACLNVPLDVVEPCGFVWSDSRLKRAGLDYHEYARVVRHKDWTAFRAAAPGRAVLASTKAFAPYTGFAFRQDDTLVMGPESAGFPAWLEDEVADRVLIPMSPGRRSINVALAAAMVLGEALRQTGGFPAPSAPEA